MISDTYTKEQDKIYVKTENGWVEVSTIYDYKTFKLPFNFGVEGTVCYNVFGKIMLKQIVDGIYLIIFGILEIEHQQLKMV